jgi:hypothetical protein
VCYVCYRVWLRDSALRDSVLLPLYVTVDAFSNLDMTEKECKARTAVWRTLYDFQNSVTAWTKGPVKVGGLYILNPLDPTA